MTHDVLKTLAAANPVPTPVGYPAEAIPSRITEARDAAARPGAAPADRIERGPRALALLVSAGVVVVASVSTLVAPRPNPAGRVAPATALVTCTVTSGPDAAARLALARAVIATRLGDVGASGTTFHLDPRTVTIGFAPRGVDRATARSACRPSTAAIRPVVSPATGLAAVGRRSTDPLHGLGFPAPRSDLDYARLTSKQRIRLTAAWPTSTAPLTRSRRPA